jgi:hypothetical protein
MKASTKMSGFLDNGETWIASGSTFFFGPARGGSITGLISSFGDLMSGTWAMFVGILDGSILDMVDAAINGIKEKGFPGAIVGGATEFYNGTANTIISQQENCNPYLSPGDKSKHDEFANGYYSGYLIGFIVQMIIAKKVCKSGKSVVSGGAKASGAAIEEGLNELASETGGKWSRISARFTEYASKWYGLKPGVRTLLICALTTSIFVGLKYAFPNIFDSWFKVGFGFAMTLDFISDATRVGLLDEDIAKVRNLEERFPFFQKDHLDIWERVRNSKWDLTGYKNYINEMENIMDANRIRPNDLARYSDLNLRDFGAYGIKDGLPEHQLKNMFEAKSPIRFGQDEILDRVTLKEGDINNFGWKHGKNDHPELWEHYGSDEAVLNNIKSTVKNEFDEHIKGVEYRYSSVIIDNDSISRRFTVIVSDKSDGAGVGTIITFFDTEL